MYERIIEEQIKRFKKGDLLGYKILQISKIWFEQIESNSNIPYVENELLYFV